MSDFRRRLFLTSAAAALFAGRTRAQPVPLGGDAGYQTLDYGAPYGTGSKLPPTFDMNFMTATLDPSVTWTRANANATDGLYTDGVGATYNTFAANAPRISASTGLLAEVFITNQLLNSNAPATQTTASLVNGTYTLWVSGTGSASPTTGTAVGTGFGGVATGLNPTSFTITTAGTVTVTVTGSLTRFQLEISATPTSYVPTVGTTVIRQVDSGTLPIAAWFNAAEGTYVVDFMIPALATGAIYELPSLCTDNNNNFAIRITGIAIQVFSFVTNVNSGFITLNGSVSAGLTQRVAFTYQTSTNILSGSLNGGPVVDSITTSMPTINQIKFGAVRTANMNGFTRRIRYYPRMMQTAELRNITALGSIASLDFDFMSPGKLNPMLTFTRTTTGTYFDNTGTMQTAAANAPRWDYDTNPPVLRGLLIEEARTNLVLNSGRLDNASWTTTNNTVTAGATGAPDGTTAAIKLTPTALSAAHTIAPVAGSAITAGGINTLSLFAKAAGYPRVFLQLTNGAATNGFNAMFNLSTGTAGSIAYIGSGSGGQVLITPAGNGWYRCAISGVFDGTSTQATMIAIVDNGTGAAFAGDTVSGLYLWGAQIEAGAMPSSYIPTTTVAVTRAAEFCSLPTGAWFNAGASSLAVDYMLRQSPNPSGFNRVAAGLGDGTINNRMFMTGQSVPAAAAIATSIAGVTTGSTSLGNAVANAVSKIAASWNGTTPIGVLNGGSVVSTSAGIPSVTTLLVGTNYTGINTHINGHVRRVRYWPLALAPNELQTVTT